MTITARCGCKYRVDDTYVWYLAWPDPEEWRVIAAIPALEAPKTPTGWANENIIWSHEKECLEFQEWSLADGMKMVQRLMNEAIFVRQWGIGLTIFRKVW